MPNRALPVLLASILVHAALAPPAWSSAGAGAPASETTTGAPVAATEGAGSDRTLTVSEAVARSLGFRPEVAAARAEERRTASALAEARAALLPTLDGLAAVSHYDEPVPVTPFHGFGSGAFPDFETTLVQGSLQIGYTLWDGGRRGARIDRAGAEVEAAGARLSAAQQEVAARTADGFLRVLTLGTTLEAADARIDALEAERHRVEQLLAVGRAAAVDLRRAEAALAAARADRVDLTAAMETAERSLARQIGADPGETRYARLVPLPTDAHAEPTEPLPERDALYRALEANPELLAGERRVAAAEAGVEVARGADRPTLTAVSDLQELGSTEGTYEGEWSAGFRLSVPLFHGGALEERKVQAQATRDAAAEDLRAARLGLENALDAALATFDGARARQRALAEAEAQYAEVVRVEKLRLDTGVGVQADYLDAEAALLRARAGLANAVRAEIVARVEIARLTGALDLQWVERQLE